MNTHENKIAVITGGGSGIGRALAIALATQGCNVATCDVSEGGLAETAHLAAAAAEAAGQADVTFSTHLCDVSDESAMNAFALEVLAAHDSDHVNLVFNNAGLSGGGSLFTATRESWDRCFAVCWGGVYHGTRAFLPLLAAAEAGHLVNISSINGLWASMGPDLPHTAYSAAKFAVRGFSEALITDLAINAPHVKVSVVMPGHVGTRIVENSARHGADAVNEDELAFFTEIGAMFHDHAPITADDAAGIILEGMRAGKWRILVGDDAQAIDEAVRSDPERAYEGRTVADLMSSIPTGEAGQAPN